MNVSLGELGLKIALGLKLVLTKVVSRPHSSYYKTFTIFRVGNALIKG